MVHKATDRWVDGFATLFERNTAPELFSLSEHAQATRLELLGACMKAAVQKFYGSYLEQEWANCPLCDQQLHRKRVEAKKISTAQGQFVLERPYFYCGDCRHGFYPLDEALGLTAARHQYDIQKRITLMAAEVPFEKASTLLEQLTELRVATPVPTTYFALWQNRRHWSGSSPTGTKSSNVSTGPPQPTMDNRRCWSSPPPAHTAPPDPKPLVMRSAGRGNTKRSKGFASTC